MRRALLLVCTIGCAAPSARSTTGLPSRCAIEGAAPRLALPLLEDEVEAADEVALFAIEALERGFPAVSVDGARALILDSGDERSPYAELLVMEMPSGRTLERHVLWTAREVFEAVDAGPAASRSFQREAQARVARLARRIDAARYRTLRELPSSDERVVEDDGRVVLWDERHERVLWERRVGAGSDECEALEVDTARAFVDPAGCAAVVRVHVSGPDGACASTQWFPIDTNAR